MGKITILHDCTVTCLNWLEQGTNTFLYTVLLQFTLVAQGTEGYKVDCIFQFPQIAQGFQPI